MTLPSAEILAKAFLSRDKRFDGRFYVGVRTTGIYCRPICPARPLAKNVGYFRSAAEAEAAGYRPCLRCRPDLSPTAPLFHGTAAVVGRALRLLQEGAPVATLSDRVGLTDRHLRRLFAEHLGASPVEVEGSRRLHLARQLLTQTSLPITEIAFSSGFRSLRRFNAAFLERYRRAPRLFRKESAEPGTGLLLQLPVLEPYDWEFQLDFLRRHAVPGLEICTKNSYRRELPGSGSVTVTRGNGCLEVRLENCAVGELRGLLARVRHLFDVDHNPATIPRAARGVRIPGCWDGFETAVSVIVGQVVSTAGARAAMGKLFARFGKAGVFPGASVLAQADLTGCGLTRAKERAVRELALALRGGEISLERSAPLEETRARLRKIPGIGAWTAEVIALRCLGDPDAFPAGDLVVARALQLHDPEPWRPWRGYLTLWLWKNQKKGTP